MMLFFGVGYDGIINIFVWVCVGLIESVVVVLGLCFFNFVLFGLIFYCLLCVIYVMLDVLL